MGFGVAIDSVKHGTLGEEASQMLDASHESYGGQALRAAREAAGIEIATLSFELRIPKNYLYAIEAEDYDELPGTTYGFGYIRSYCKFLEIDDTPYLDTFKMRTAIAGAGTHYSFPDEALEPRMSGAMTAMLVVLVLLSGYIGWQIFDRYQPTSLDDDKTIVATLTIENQPVASGDELASNRTEIATQTVQEEGVAAGEGVVVTEEEAPQQVASAQDDAATVPETTGQETTVPETTVPEETAQEDTTQVATATDDAGTQDAGSDEAGSGEAGTDGALTQVANAANDGPQASASAQATLRQPTEEILISAKSAAWVEIVSENGDVILSQLFQAGQDYVAPAGQKLYLSTGNAGGLVLNIPGLEAFQAGAIGEIIRDLPLSRDSIRSRRSAVIQ